MRGAVSLLLLLSTTCCLADDAGMVHRLYVLGGSDPRASPKGQVAAFTLNAARTNGTWAPLPAMGSVRESGRAAALNGSIYHVGGSTNGGDYPYLNSTLRYAPATDTAWTPVAPLLCNPAHPAFCPDVLPGGQPTDDPQGGGIADHAAVALGGYLYVVGGTNGTTSLASVERYSPLADKWEYMAAMSIGRCYVAAAVLNGRIFATGGSATPAGPCTKPSVCPRPDSPGALNTVESYDPETNKWSPGKPMIIARSTHALAASGGKLYALGGEDGGSLAVTFDAVERYDPSRDTWTLIAPMTVPRCQVGAGVLDGLVFAVGGYNDLTDFGWTSTVENDAAYAHISLNWYFQRRDLALKQTLAVQTFGRYDESTNSWSFVASFPLERQYSAVAVL